ncbi:MAG: DUF4867 family protein [Eubacteriales bacterium]|nr:DUF4867 family protein [Eubacteriales bacterium]
MEILNVTDRAFRRYGRMIQGLPCEDIISAMAETPVPDDVIYTPSDAELENCESASKVAHSLYGGMPVQIGYCNGHNKYLNAAEYHRDSEVNIACTDLVLILGKEEDIEEDYTYDTANMQAFFVPKGTVLEVYATTLHYAPCHTQENGFQCVVILPKGTNTDIDKKAETTPEDKLLFARNKWLLAHPEAGIEGAFCGLKGENLHI